MPIEPEHKSLGLPPRVFFYIPEQIALMLELDVDYVKKKLLFYEGREAGICPKSKMKAYNVAPEGETPQWRISERVFIGYLKSRRIKFYARGYIV